MVPHPFWLSLRHRQRMDMITQQRWMHPIRNRSFQAIRDRTTRRRMGRMEPMPMEEIMLRRNMAAMGQGGDINIQDCH